jgi:hypothetical protein
LAALRLCVKFFQFVSTCRAAALKIILLRLSARACRGAARRAKTGLQLDYPPKAATRNT